MAFKKDFIWGTGTSAYQIEGAANEDGKGESVWDSGCKVSGRIAYNHTGDVACDHYHKYKEDVALLKELHIKHYRFSINWTRVFPNGTGEVNEKGVRFYLNLVDELIKNGITPWVTLFHWDYPQKLFERGGWLNPDSPKWFADYAEFIVKTFGEKVTNYMIINEPQCFVESGHVSGRHAPFMKYSEKDMFKIMHNVLLACGLAEKRMRKAVDFKLNIGFSGTTTVYIPLKESLTEKARELSFKTEGDFYNTAVFADPIILGKYDVDTVKWQKRVGFSFNPEDMKTIKCNLDFYGINEYCGAYLKEEDGKAVIDRCGLYPLDMMDWEVTPKVAYYGPKFIYERYKIPVMVTENGIALTEWVTEKGQVPDAFRVQYIKEIVKNLEKAQKEVDLRGYFYWSFMDNFEWAKGYTRRFGLVYVDYKTQKRYPKDSAYFFKDVIDNNGKID